MSIRALKPTLFGLISVNQTPLPNVMHYCDIQLLGPFKVIKVMFFSVFQEAMKRIFETKITAL